MPALSSLIGYRPGKKAKAAIRAPFLLLRGDSTTTSSTTSTSHQHFTPTEVIDINHSRYSLDVDSGNPSTSLDQDVSDVCNDPRPSQHIPSTPPPLNPSTSPQVELDIDLSSNGFSDWLEAFNGPDPRKDAKMNLLTRLKNSLSLNVELEELKEGEDEVDRGASSSEDIITSLEAMDASYPGTLSEYNDMSQRYPLRKRSNSLSIPDASSPSSRQASRPDLFIGTRTARPLSSQSDIISSALSGTTIARALISNSFILSDRASLYRSGSGAGLTRTDSTTLPHWDRNSSVMFYNDRFSTGSDVPPIPLNAELLYEPPRISRNEEKRAMQSSASSLSPIPPISNLTPPTGDIINADFDSEAGTPPLVKLSPLSLSRIPTPATNPHRASTPPSQEVTQQTPVDAQVLSSDPDTPSSAPSSGHASPELAGLLNYYSIPDSPELLIAGGVFKPMISPISEELSSQLSPPISFRNDRRDSYKSQPVGARYQPSGRSRDSTVLPMRDQPTDVVPKILFSLGGDQSKIAPTTATSSNSSLYLTGDDNPNTTVTPPQLSKSGHALSSIEVVRNSRDMDAYNITMVSSFGDATPSAEDLMVSQEFPETPALFSPMFSARSNAPEMPPDDDEKSAAHTSAATAELPLAQLLLKRASGDHLQQGISKAGTTASASSGSPLNQIVDISESPEAIPQSESLTADDAATEDIISPPYSSSGPSATHSNISLLVDASRSPNGPITGQDTSDGSTSLTDIDSTSSKSRPKGLPSIPTTSSSIIPQSSHDESSPISLSGTSTTPIVAPPSQTSSQTVEPSVPRGRLPPAALTFSSQTSFSGPDGLVAVNGTDQGGQHSAELEFQTPQHDSPPGVASTQKSLAYQNETFRGRASDLFRGTSLGSPPPYYSVVSEALMQDNPLSNFPGQLSFSQSQGPENVAGPSSGESTHSNGRSRENSYLAQRTRIRPPLPAGPRRPSQPSVNSPGPRRGSFSSVTSSSVVPDSRVRPPTRPPNPLPSSPIFQTPAPKWKGYTMEVAKWTFTSAQLQAIVSRAIRQSAEASSIRLLRLEVLDDEIPAEVMRLESQRTSIKLRYKTSTRRRTAILDSLYSSLSTLEDVNSTQRLVRQLDELKELTQTLDRLAEEIHSVDEQLSHLQSLTHIHTGSALSLALRKLNASFLKQVAENQVLRNQIQSLEAERDEGWQQAQSVANEYDQMSDNSPSIHSSRVSAKRKSCIWASRAGLRTSLQRSPAGLGTPSTKSLPPPLPRRPTNILTDTPVRSSGTSSTSGFTPTTESRALAQAQDELYSMLGILNPERPLNRSRSETSPRSPRFRSSRSTDNSITRRRRSSLPEALSLTEAYHVMAADASHPIFTHLPRNAILATIDMLSTNPR